MRPPAKIALLIVAAWLAGLALREPGSDAAHGFAVTAVVVVAALAVGGTAGAMYARTARGRSDYLGAREGVKRARREYYGLVGTAARAGALFALAAAAILAALRNST